MRVSLNVCVFVCVCMPACLWVNMYLVSYYKQFNHLIYKIKLAQDFLIVSYPSHVML